MRKQAYILFLFVMGVQMLPAQETVITKIYTLDECKQLAVKNNVKLKNSRIDTQAALETEKEAFTKYFPSVSATGCYFNANKDLIQISSTDMNIGMIKNGVMGDVSAVQTVFAGGRILNGNKLAKLGVEVNKYQLQQSEKEVALTTEQYYWQIVSLKEKLKTINTLTGLVNSIYKDVELTVKAGITNRNDLLQVQLKQNSIASNKLKIENGLNLCRMVLAQYIGVSESNFDIVTIDFNELPDPQTLKVDHSAALLNTPEYNLLQKNVEANRLQKQLAIGKLLPSVGVGAGYFYDNLMDKAHPFGMIFATVSIPISDWWGGSHNIKKQNFDLIKAQNDSRDKNELLLINMQKHYNDLEESYQQVNLAKNSIETATENFRLNTDYYHAGTCTISDLLQAESSLQQSRDQYTDVYTQHLIYTLQYLQATGR